MTLASAKEGIVSKEAKLGIGFVVSPHLADEPIDAGRLSALNGTYCVAPTPDAAAAVAQVEGAAASPFPETFVIRPAGVEIRGELSERFPFFSIANRREVQKPSVPNPDQVVAKAQRGVEVFAAGSLKGYEVVDDLPPPPCCDAVTELFRTLLNQRIVLPYGCADPTAEASVVKAGKRGHHTEAD